MTTDHPIPGTTVYWKWYAVGASAKHAGAWCVVNRATGHIVYATSESAALSIVELAHALKTGQPKPLTHKTLERKAKELEGVPVQQARYWTWSGRRTLTYHTDAHDVSKGAPHELP